MSTSGQLPDLDDLSLDDIRRLIQSLHRRQAELERQNQDVTTSRDKYFALYDEAPVAYIVVSEEGLILEANRASAALLGAERGDLVEKPRPLTDFIAPEEHTRFHARHRAAYEIRTRQTCEMRLVRADGTSFPARLEYIAAADAEGAVQCRVVISDLTEQAQAERESRTRTEGLTAVTELAIELAAAPPDADVFELVAERLRSITGAIATSVSAYHPERQELSVQYIASPARIISQTNKLLGRDIIGMRMPVSPQMLEEMLTETVLVAGDLSEVSFGTIPRSVAVIIQKALGLGDFVGLSLQYSGQLAGTAMNVMPKGQSPPPLDVLEALAHVAAVSLRRKRAEQALAEQTRALRESEERYRGLFEGTPVGLYRTTPEGQILSANPALVRMLGYPDEETLIATEATNIYVNPEEREREQGLLESEGLVRHFETQLRRRDGAVIWVQDTARIVRDTQGHVLYYEGSMEDITQRKYLEEQIRQQQRLAAVGQLAGGIAHDFNNLLTSIMLNAEILLQKFRLPAEVTQGLKIITQESQRAAKLVQQILDFGLRSMLDRRPIDLVSTVEEAAGILRSKLPEAIHLRIQAKTDTCLVNADRGRIQQALMNLALNARDAMPEGGELGIGIQRIEVAPGEPPPLPEMEHHADTTMKRPRTRASILNLTSEVETDIAIADEYIADEYIADEYIRGRGQRPRQAWACLSVSDTGSGMSEEVQTHLFEPFFTTKPVGQGTGLGLAQVYGIVKQHGGYIDWDTASGRGTIFRIYLPIAASEKREKASSEETLIPAGKGEIILLVEGSERIREAGLRTLEPLGYRVLTAADGQEALAVYRSAERVDLVITDLVMPTMDGRDLMRKVRETDPEIEGLVTTGYAWKPDLHELKQEGIVGFVHKPLDLETLARAIRRALDEGHARQGDVRRGSEE